MKAIDFIIFIIYIKQVYLACPDGQYVDSSSQCVNCEASLNCKTCNSGTSCLTCNEPTQYLTNKACCNLGKFHQTTPSSCLPCGSNCQKCTDQTICITCESNFKLKSDNQTCFKDCGENKYPDSSNICQPCINNCKYCEEANKCITCNDAFFKDSSNICQSCLQNCKICSDSLTCTACIDGYFKSSTGQCQICNSNLNCKTCTDAQSCTTCLDTFFKSGTQCVSSCGDGKYVDSNNVCQNCSSSLNCKTCTNNQTCSSCIDGFYINNSNLCEPCDSNLNCKTCQDAQTCTSCLDNLYKDGSTCISNCGDGKYADSSAKTCNACDSSLNCKTCKDGVSCETCNQYYQIENKKCVRSSCPNGEYLDSTNKLCQSCGYDLNCKTCSNSTECLTCSDQFYQDEQKCLLQCPDGKYGDSSFKCQVCPSFLFCKTCSTSNQCQTCIEGYEIIQNQCLKKCTDSQYRDGTTCKECNKDIGCATCTDGSTCKTCKDNYKLQKDTKTCTEKCVEDYVLDYNNQSQCIKKEECITKISSQNICIPYCEYILEISNNTDNKCSEKCDFTQEKKITTTYDNNGKIQVDIKCVDIQTPQALKDKTLNLNKLITSAEFSKILDINVKNTYQNEIQQILDKLETNIQSITIQETQPTSDDKITDTADVFNNLISISQNLSKKIDIASNPAIILQSNNIQIVGQNIKSGMKIKKNFNMKDFEANSVELVEKAATTVTVTQSISVGYSKKNIFCKQQCSKSLPFFMVNLSNPSRLLDDSGFYIPNQFTAIYTLEKEQNQKDYACVSNFDGIQISSDQIYDPSTNSVTCIFGSNISLIYDPTCNFHNTSYCEESATTQVSIIIALTIISTLILCCGYFLSQCCKYSEDITNKSLLLNQTTQQDFNIDLQNIEKDNL